MKFNSSNKLFSWYYSIIITLVVIVGTVSSVLTYIKVSGSTQGILLKDVASIVSVFDSKNIVALKGDESDLENPAYITLKNKLEKIPNLNTDVRFAYLWGYRDGNVFFLVDSEPADSEDYSPPGQIYDEATELDRDIFLKKLPSGIEISSDRWGTWLTALTPMIDEETNEIVAVMGMDMKASRYFETIYVYTAIPIISTIFVLLLIIIGLVLRKREQEFLSLKSELVSIASHEIRSPLTGITWIMEALVKDSENMSDRQKHDIGMVKSKSEELLNTINDLLDSAVAEKTSKRNLIKKPTSMRTLFEIIKRKSLLNLSQKNIELIIDDSVSSDTNVLGDSDKIGRMFNNLISNAIKYSKNNGKIVVGKIEKKQSFVFYIRDEGIGISREDQSKIFKGFFRTESAKKLTSSGTGLGLHYVKQIAELHDGKVWCESEEGKGSTFFVELQKIKTT